MTHDFNEKLQFSLGDRQSVDMNLLKQSITGCESVEKTDDETDKAGIDYIATLRRGAKIMIDAKTRAKGASRYWKNREPEFALEIWSARPKDGNHGKTGWTLDESSQVDLILYTFDPSDCKTFYLLPFQFLRMAFVEHRNEWITTYGKKTQDSGAWTSEAVFVPASVVLDAIREQMIRTNIKIA